MFYGEKTISAVVYEDDASWAPALTQVQLAWDPDRKTGAMTRSCPGKYEVMK